jgi:hypothetical protein
LSSSTRTSAGADPERVDPQRPEADGAPAGDDSAATAAAAPSRLDPTPDAEPRDDASSSADATRSWKDRLAGWPAQAAASTLLLALLSHMRYTYMAGDRDHLVLSPMGMRWADPDAFAGDWTLANAPQPHWLFDIITWIGASTGTLGAIYLLYWLAGMFAFGVATTLLARTWTPRASWVAVLAVTFIAAIGPLYVLGSGVHLYAVALPNGLGGCLLYLCAAALLVGRHRLAAVAGVATALAHVQHGVVALVLLLVMAAAVWVLRRTLDRWLLGSVVATVAVVVFNLKLRPVAGELKDFQEVCGLLIPYHCEATSWQWSDFYGGVGFVALALLTVGFVARGERFRWVIVIVLPFLGLMGGVFADRLDVPVLGLAAQGLNVYRLSIELFQFAIWGLLMVAFAKLTPRRRWIALAVTLVVAWYGTRSQFWALDGNPTWTGEQVNQVSSFPLLLIAGLCLVAAVVVQTVPDLVTERQHRAVQVAVGAGVLVMLLSAVAGNQFALHKPNPRFFPWPALTAWGEQVQRVVPPGEQLLVPPSAVQVRMATHRGVVVDCKLAPYGGDPWREYRSRMEALGGFIECGAPGWRKVSADQLAEFARRYGAGYVVVRSDQATDVTIATALAAQGWTQVAGERPGAPYRVFKAPWETK